VTLERPIALVRIDESPFSINFIFSDPDAGRERGGSVGLLGVIDGDVVVEDDKQEQRHPEHIGEYCQLHISHHF